MLQPPLRVVASFAVPLAGAALVTGLAVLAAPEAPIAAPVVVPELAVDVAEPQADEPVPVEDMPVEDEPAEPAPELDPAQFSFIIEVEGMRYIPLSHDAVSPHARTSLISEDGVQTAITPLAERELPESLAAWRGHHEVVVDGNCHALVVGFAQIARLTGDPGYAGDDKAWSAESVMEHGDPVIAAKIHGCKGTWARDASLPRAAVGDKMTSKTLVAAARTDLFLSDLAKQTQDDWRAAGLDGDWRTEVSITALVARHPVTNARWIVLHAKRGGGCGDHEVNILAAYIANDDGTVSQISAQTVDLDSIQDLVDYDRDGTFEVTGTQTWGLNRVFIDLHGNSLSTLPLQFYGCPC